MKKASFLVGILLAAAATAEVTAPPRTMVREIVVKTEALHSVGKAGFRGWELDYKRDRPGYAISGLKDPLFLEPGLYRATFEMRRGHYPKKGLLFSSYGLFRIELWDTTTDKLIAQRELQIADFSGPNRYEPRWLEFSMESRERHTIEPRVYWIGLANGEISSIQFERFSEVSLTAIEQKATRLADKLAHDHLENGFVVSRELNGAPDETGDATTYTGFYVTSLAWKYAATGDALTYQALENGLATLHNAIKGTFDEPIITRYVDVDGNPFSKIPSKDVYTSFFLAMSVAYPRITNPALKKQMRDDVDRIATKFLRDDLAVKSGSKTLFSLTPYLSESEIRSGIRKLLDDKKDVHQFVKNLKMSRRYLPFGELWPGMKEVIKALEAEDEQRCFELTLPTMNGVFLLGERVRDVLREQYRQDLFPKRYTNKEYPGIKLADMLTTLLKRFPKKEDGQRLREFSDLKILASNALISLHIVKTAAEITEKSTFRDYYRENLYSQDALLKTALDWYGIEDELTQLTAGNPRANSERRGYLGTLALMNLISLEKNPTVQASYRSLLKREWSSYRGEDNPMVTAFNCLASKKEQGDMEQVLRDLSLYPENRHGYGKEFWDAHDRELADTIGGGEWSGFSREPLPVSHRPKDSFLWQRNPRRLKGDGAKIYPSTDFLFVYWFCRANKLIPSAPPPEVAGH